MQIYDAKIYAWVFAKHKLIYLQFDIVLQGRRSRSGQSGHSRTSFQRFQTCTIKFGNMHKSRVLTKYKIIY